MKVAIDVNNDYLTLIKTKPLYDIVWIWFKQYNGLRFLTENTPIMEFIDFLETHRKLDSLQINLYSMLEDLVKIAYDHNNSPVEKLKVKLID